jgi:hypothetical protein
LAEIYAPQRKGIFYICSIVRHLHCHLTLKTTWIFVDVHGWNFLSIF